MSLALNRKDALVKAYKTFFVIEEFAILAGKQQTLLLRQKELKQNPLNTSNDKDLITAQNRLKESLAHVNAEIEHFNRDKGGRLNALHAILKEEFKISESEQFELTNLKNRVWTEDYLSSLGLTDIKIKLQKKNEYPFSPIANHIRTNFIMPAMKHYGIQNKEIAAITASFLSAAGIGATLALVSKLTPLEFKLVIVAFAVPIIGLAWAYNHHQEGKAAVAKLAVASWNSIEADVITSKITNKKVEIQSESTVNVNNDTQSNRSRDGSVDITDMTFGI